MSKGQKGEFFGVNSNRTSYNGLIHTSLHAETCGLLRLLKITYGPTISLKTRGLKLSKTAVWVVRIIKKPNRHSECGDYELAPSKPCDNCQLLMSRFGVRYVYYTDIVDGRPVLSVLELAI